MEHISLFLMLLHALRIVQHASHNQQRIIHAFLAMMLFVIFAQETFQQDVNNAKLVIFGLILLAIRIAQTTITTTLLIAHCAMFPAKYALAAPLLALLAL